MITFLGCYCSSLCISAESYLTIQTSNRLYRKGKDHTTRYLNGLDIFCYVGRSIYSFLPKILSFAAGPLTTPRV